MQDSLTGDSYDLGGLSLPDLDQDMFIVGDVINEAGDVYITNKEGSINVSGTPTAAGTKLAIQVRRLPNFTDALSQSGSVANPAPK